MLVINIRGTHGSGKSTIVKAILDRYDCGSEPMKVEGEKKPQGYQVSSKAFGKLFIVGPYETACGGCDAIQPFDKIFPRVEEYAQQGHVIFEGALVSTSGIGRIKRCVELYGNNFVAAFMDTPLDVCLERIKKRREARGNTKPLNPKNTTNKWNCVQSSIKKIEAVGARTAIIDYRNAVPQILGMLINAHNASSV
jgi:predicted kinase